MTQKLDWSKYRAPEGYVNNQYGYLLSWAWAEKRMRDDDRAIYNRLQLIEEPDHQKAFNKYCREYLEVHHHEFALNELDD